MGTDTISAVNQPNMTVTPLKPLRDNVMRIAAMTKKLLDEIRTQPLDTAALDRLRTIDTHVIGELLTDLTADLRQELQRLALPLSRHTELSDTELRLVHAQLVGWLQGLLQTATDTSTLASPNYPDRPQLEPSSPTTCLPDDIDSKGEYPAVRSARRTLITAITRRITQQRLTAAQAADLLRLTGPRVTQLLHADIDEFTLDELVSLLPVLELTIQVAPRPNVGEASPALSHAAHDGLGPQI